MNRNVVIPNVVLVARSMGSFEYGVNLVIEIALCRSSKTWFLLKSIYLGINLQMPRSD